MISQPLFDAPSAAGGGTGGAGGNASVGSGQAALSGGIGGGNAAAPVSLTADSLFIPPGSTEPVKWSDYQQGFVPRADHEGFRDTFLRDFIGNFRKLQATHQQNTRSRPGQASAQNQPRQSQAAQVLAALRDKPMLNGRDVNDLVQAVQAGDIAPIHQWANNINQLVTLMAKKIAAHEKGLGAVGEERNTSQFQGKIANAIKANYPGQEQDEFLNEFAQDVYLSHDPNDKTLDRDFSKLLKSRIDGMVKFVRKLDQLKAEEAKKMRFTRPSAGVQPGKGLRPKFESNAEIAERFFQAEAGQGY